MYCNNCGEETESHNLCMRILQDDSGACSAKSHNICKVCGGKTRNNSILCPECRYPKEGYKRCNTCLEIKPYSAYYAAQHSTDGYAMVCAECRRKSKKETEKKRCLNCGKAPDKWFIIEGNESGFCEECGKEYVKKYSGRKTTLESLAEARKKVIILRSLT